MSQNIYTNGINVIKTLSAKKMGYNVYVGITFFDRWNKDQNALYTFRFDFTENNVNKRYIIQISQHGARLFFDGQNKRLNNVIYSRNTDFEAVFPLSIFGAGITKLKVIYYWRGDRRFYSDINRATVSRPLDIALM